MSEGALMAVLKQAISDEARWPAARPLFDKDVSADNLKVTYMRTLMKLAGPIGGQAKRYETLDDDADDQKDVVIEFSADVKELSDSNDAKYRAVVRTPRNTQLTNKEFQDTIKSDVAFAVFSVAFVFCYIMFHLKSLFLAWVSMMLILLSFPISYLIYSGLFQITMNTTLNQMVIFIVLGIAADDIFVFCDAWR